MSELVKRLRVLQEFWNRRDALTRYMAVEMAVETVVVSAKSADALEAQAKRIAELEARLEITGPYDGIAARDETIRLLEAENARLRVDSARLDWLEDCTRCYWVTIQTQPNGGHVRSGQGVGTRAAIDAARKDQSHSANTVGGPTPVMDAAPACERKE